MGDLPAWPEIKDHALTHLDGARNEASEAANWLRGIDSPLTPGQRKAAREALRLANQAKNLLDPAGDRGEGECR